MKKAIGRMNKGELLEFAKEMKDIVKGKDLGLAMLEGESQEKSIKINEYLETIRFLRDELTAVEKLLELANALNQRLRKKNKVKTGKNRNLCNLFGLLS